jgi:hypothetical protein
MMKKQTTTAETTKMAPVKSFLPRKVKNNPIPRNTAPKIHLYWFISWKKAFIVQMGQAWLDSW